jgi:CheY-like chemotaxis protein
MRLGSSVDLVLLDLSMPEISGEEVLQMIRCEKPAVKGVIFAGYGHDKEDSAETETETETVIQNHSAASRSSKKCDGYSTTNRGDKSTSVPPDCFQGE